jgi:hypothetical protein
MRIVCQYNGTLPEKVFWEFTDYAGPLVFDNPFVTTWDQQVCMGLAMAFPWGIDHAFFPGDVLSSNILHFNGDEQAARTDLFATAYLNTTGPCPVEDWTSAALCFVSSKYRPLAIPWMEQNEREGMQFLRVLEGAPECFPSATPLLRRDIPLWSPAGIQKQNHNSILIH